MATETRNPNAASNSRALLWVIIVAIIAIATLAYVYRSNDTMTRSTYDAGTVVTPPAATTPDTTGTPPGAGTVPPAP